MIKFFVLFSIFLCTATSLESCCNDYLKNSYAQNEELSNSGTVIIRSRSINVPHKKQRTAAHQDHTFKKLYAKNYPELIVDLSRDPYVDTGHHTFEINEKEKMREKNNETMVNYLKQECKSPTYARQRIIGHFHTLTYKSTIHSPRAAVHLEESHTPTQKRALLFLRAIANCTQFAEPENDNNRLHVKVLPLLTQQHPSAVPEAIDMDTSEDVVPVPDKKS